MTVAIMQPYIFPYIGYFHLIAASDKFVFYDDVNFIKQGWVNRNRILNNGSPLTFTVPLESQSSFSKIMDVKVNGKLIGNWSTRFLKTLEMSYRKAPYFDDIFPILKNVFYRVDSCTISEMAKQSVLLTCEYLNITHEIISSNNFGNEHLSGSERVIDICKRLNGSHYINAIGGIELYDKDNFSKNNLVLNFVKTELIPYSQFKNNFIPGLSIIDILMFNSVNEITEMLSKYELV